MPKDMSILRDSGSERALLGTIVKNGKDALIDSQGIVRAKDFSLPINKAIFNCLETLADDPNCERFDIESIKAKAKTLGLNIYFQNPKDLEYLEYLEQASTAKENLPMFALQVKKYSIARDLYERYENAKNYLVNISGQESLSDIVRNAESNIVDFVTGADNGNTLEEIGKGIEDHVEEIISTEPVDQIGLPTGFPVYDRAIGGGPRPGTVTVIGARPKVGKSFLALNMGRNMALTGIPVLYLDTEMTKEYQTSRFLAMQADCPISLLETRKFNRNKELVSRVREAGKIISSIPFTYQCIAGMGHSEALALARRWLVRKVGFNQDGKANPCIIVYDYMKLTSGESLTKHTPEYIILGLMLTELHNFAVRYNVPILGFVQLNRDGIDGDDGSVIAGSDRILWLCSSMSFLRNKSDQDKDLQCGWEYGNKKLNILDTRMGAAFENEHDYLNLYSSLRPRTREEEATGFIREGLTFSAIVGTEQKKFENQSRDAQPNQGSGERKD